MSEDLETPVADPETSDPVEPETPPEAPPAEVEPETAPPVEAPPAPVAPPPAAPPEPPQSALERELAEIEAKVQADDFDGYSKEGKALLLKHSRLAAKIEAAPAREIQQQQQEQKAALAYWQGWGKGTDIAQLQYGKTVPATKAQALYKDAYAAIQANPRYQRAEYQNNPDRLQAIITEKWIDSLGEAAKKPAPTAARQQASARVSGNTPSSGAPSGAAKTAKQKLQDGEYDDQLRNLVK